MGEIVMEFSAPAEPLSMNDKDGREFGRAKQAWRDRAYYAWIEAHPGKGPSARRAPSPAEVFMTIPFTSNRRRDPINFARTVKAVVDGLVMAGAWPDDTPEYVSQNIPRLTIAEFGFPVVIRVVPR
jgi:hypothetical protein